MDTLSDPKDVEWLLDEKRSKLNHDLVMYYRLIEGGHDAFMTSGNTSYIDEVIKVLVY